MPDAPIQIKRYPNRRYYARHTSTYVSLQEIGEMIQAGQTVEIRDSQTGEDLTRAVLTQIIMERQPEKMALFPSDMLHFILQSNDAMADFLRDYFRHSLTYLDYLQRHSTAAPIPQPMHWVKAWLDGISPRPQPPTDAESHGEQAVGPTGDSPQPGNDAAHMAQRLEQLEQRLRELESKGG